MLTVVHVTHEAVHKIGGIGTVLEGLITAPPYQKRVARTLLVGPLFSRGGHPDQRLGPGGQVLYSSIDNRTDHPIGAALQGVHGRCGAGIVYGKRPLRSPDNQAETNVEVMLFDVTTMHAGPINTLKWRLFEDFGIPSDRFENIWEYEQYIRLAVPAIDALRATRRPDETFLIVAHEFMGLPTAFAAMLDGGAEFRTIFHAHETATVRRLVEDHPGHDLAFYNAMRTARLEGGHVEDVFGDQGGYFKHVLVAAAPRCDRILAVGPLVIEEMRFLSSDFDSAQLRLAYNGIPAHETTPSERTASKQKLQRYCKALLGSEPELVFTHVTRLVRSKGLWRDLLVLDGVDAALQRRNQRAVLLVLSTELGGPRSSDDIRRMEQDWNWPVEHREGMPDLSNGEAAFDALVREFNARSRNCKVVFINQFGFDRASCGRRVPADVEFWDIRRGSDVEFGQSIYEPFGIAQIEALSYGAICVMSTVCGCAGFVTEAAGDRDVPNIVAADYTELPAGDWTVERLLAMTGEQRLRLEKEIAATVAAVLVDRLAQAEAKPAEFLKRGYELARHMSWSEVASRYVVPAYDAVLRVPRSATAAPLPASPTTA